MGFGVLEATDPPEVLEYFLSKYCLEGNRFHADE